jgi:hypothetical protein
MPMGRACQQPTFTMSDVRRTTRNTSIKSRDAQDPVPILVTGHLAGADLTGADLTDADLTDADLTDKADRDGDAEFADANLTGARWPAGGKVPDGWVIDSGSGLLKRPAGYQR